MARTAPESRRLVTYIAMAAGLPMIFLVFTRFADFHPLFSFSVATSTTGIICVALALFARSEGKVGAMWQRLSVAFIIMALGTILLLIWLFIPTEGFLNEVLKEALGAAIPISIGLVVFIGLAIFCALKASKAREPDTFSRPDQQPHYPAQQPPQAQPRHIGSAWQNPSEHEGPFRN